VVVFWIVHYLNRFARLQMRPGHKSRSAVLGREGIYHEDAANQRPPIASILDVHMKPFRRRAGIECSRAHAAEFERGADDLTTSSQQRPVDVDPVELRPSIDEIINPCRRPGPAGVHIGRVGRRYRVIVGTGKLFTASWNRGTRHDDKAKLAQLPGSFGRQMM